MSFSKGFITNSGGIPVQYIPKKARIKRDNITKAEFYSEMVQEFHSLFEIFSRLAREASQKPGVSQLEKRIRNLHGFFDFHIFSYLKFFDNSKSEEDPDNYYFEREWRVIGNVKFSISDIKSIFLPEKYSDKLREVFPEFEGQIIYI